jgi:hypothetical protein
VFALLPGRVVPAGRILASLAVAGMVTATASVAFAHLA